MALNHTDLSKEDLKIRKIGGRNISIIFLLGIAGQIAWAVENSWFNTFVYDELTTSPRPIAWMVAVSAITATLTTIIMGTLSDSTYLKWGRRKPYLVLGYVFWGITTIVFPMVEWIQVLGVAVVMVIIADAVMTFFGSTANDAAFNAWLTDIGHSSNRNRINSLYSIATLLANLIALGAAGIIIESYGYFIFFYGLGGIVTLSGILAQFLVKETPVPPEKQVPKKPFFQEFKKIFTRNNRILFLLFLNMAISGIASQISSPYLFIYIEHYLGFPKETISIIGVIAILGASMLIGILGYLSHNYNRKYYLMVIVILNSSLNVWLAFTRSLLGLTILYLFSLGLSMSGMAVLEAWLQDKYPKEDIGRFQGVRMIFFVALPMVIGPPIGASVIEKYGIPTSIDEVDGFIPSHHIFIVSAIIALFAIIPLFFIEKSEGKVHLITKE